MESRAVVPVAAGGALGALARYDLGLAVPGPAGTVLINVSGCLLIGVLTARLNRGGAPRGTFAVNVTGSFVLGAVLVRADPGRPARHRLLRCPDHLLPDHLLDVRPGDDRPPPPHNPPLRDHLGRDGLLAATAGALMFIP